MNKLFLFGPYIESNPLFIDKREMPTIVIDHFTVADCRRLAWWIVLLISTVIFVDLYIWNIFKIYIEDNLLTTVYKY